MSHTGNDAVYIPRRQVLEKTLEPPTLLTLDTRVSKLSAEEDENEEGPLGTTGNHDLQTRLPAVTNLLHTK